MLELFPISKEQLFKLPDLAVDKGAPTDTYKSLFLNELLALETSAKRNLTPATYFKLPSGDTNLSVPDVVLDVSTFYLFAHKTLVSTIFILAKSLPHEKARGIGFNSYTAFTNGVIAEKTETLGRIKASSGKKLLWAQNAIVNKRDDLVQHWQGNASNKFFTMICAWDLPYLVYYNPKDLDKLNLPEIDSTLALVKRKVKATIDPKADALQKLAWMEAWSPNLSNQVQDDINNLLNNDIFINLPITPQLINKLDDVISSLLAEALSNST